MLILLILLNIILWKNLDFYTSKLSLYDYPNDNLRVHSQKVSLITGFFLIINIFIIFTYSFFFKNNPGIEVLSDIYVVITLFSLFLVGYFDDRFSLRPSIRLILFSAIFFFFLNINEYFIIQNIEFNTYKFSISNNYSIIFTILCFLIYLNAFNFFDGINLQSGLHTLFIYIILFFKLDYNYEIFFLIFFYAYFLILNGKNLVFLGNAGAYLTAGIISIFLIFYFKKQILTTAEIFILMSLPGLDMIRIIFKRLLLKTNPFKGDLNHIHHLLIKKYDNVKTNIVILLSQILNYFFYLSIKNDFLSVIFSILIYIFLLFLGKKKHEKI